MQFFYSYTNALNVIHMVLNCYFFQAITKIAKWLEAINTPLSTPAKGSFEICQRPLKFVYRY